jgi:hypothetical protein
MVAEKVIDVKNAVVSFIALSETGETVPYDLLLSGYNLKRNDNSERRNSKVGGDERCFHTAGV